MDPRGRNPAYLWDMLESAKLIKQFLSEESYSDFTNSKLSSDLTV